MKQLVFTVFDEKAHAYYPPWFLKEVDMARRVFDDCVNDKEHNFGMHPSDYTLFVIGSFDDCTGILTSDGVRSLGNGLEFVRGFVAEETTRGLTVQDLRDGFKADGEDRETA